MSITSSYSPTAYDRLPSLADAGKMFEDRNAEDIVDNDFHKLFLQHKMDRTFGLVLLYRHFDLHPEEQLVEYRGTSVPWEMTPEGLPSRVQPSNWALSPDGNFHPYEFHYSGDDEADEHATSATSSEHQEFLQSFQKLLHERDMTNMFGLARYPGDDFEGTVEVTEGWTNINLHPNDAPRDVVARTATWFFSPVLYERCACVCAQTNAGHSGAHKGHVATR